MIWQFEWTQWKGTCFLWEGERQVEIRYTLCAPTDLLHFPLTGRYCSLTCIDSISENNWIDAGKHIYLNLLYLYLSENVISSLFHNRKAWLITSTKKELEIETIQPEVWSVVKATLIKTLWVCCWQLPNVNCACLTQKRLQKIQNDLLKIY